MPLPQQVAIEGIPKIEPFQRKLIELDSLIAMPDFFENRLRSTAIFREHQKLSDLIKKYQGLATIIGQITENQELIKASLLDPEIADLAREELDILQKEYSKKYRQVLLEMIPPEAADSRNTIIEIRGGAGGDEASLFAGDLYRMYCRFAENRGWKIESLGASSSECGGFKEIGFLVKGENVYKTLKYESGVHRVQRIPSTETNGRIHTSTATVAVLPEAEDVDVIINPEDIEITVCRASGPGGQGVNTTDSAVQILHKSTGLIVNCVDERSQQKNKVKAMKVLRSRLLRAKEEKEHAKYAANRKNQIGTGDRSERIRTYNFPQSRLTDHRINFSSHNLPEILEGKLDAFIQALQDEDYKKRVAELLRVSI